MQRLAIVAAALIVGLAFHSLAAAAPPSGSVSLDALLSEPHFSNASLSPNGQYLAFARNGAVNGVSVTDLQQHSTQVVLGFGTDGAPLKGLHFDWIIWKTDNRLIVGLTLLDITWVGGRVGGSIADVKYGRFVEAIDRDGRNPVRLLKGGFWDGDRSFQLDLQDGLPRDPGHILVIAPHYDHSAVWKVDIVTGKGVVVEDGSSSTYAWKTDRNGEIVARYREIGNSIQIEGRKPGEAAWNLVTTVRPGDLKELHDFEFLGPTDQPAELYVAVKPKSSGDGEYRSLHKYDFKTKTLGPSLWPDLKHDIDSIVYNGNDFELGGYVITIIFINANFEARK